MTDWNSGIIEEFRENGGKAGGMWEGAPLLLLHTMGAKSGEPRVNPVMYRAVDGGLRGVRYEGRGANSPGLVPQSRC